MPETADPYDLPLPDHWPPHRPTYVIVVDQLRERDDRDPGRGELAEHALLDRCELALEER